MNEQRMNEGVSLESFPHSALPHSLQLAQTAHRELQGQRWWGAEEGQGGRGRERAGQYLGGRSELRVSTSRWRRGDPSPRASCPANPALLLLLLAARGLPPLTRNTRQGLGQRVEGAAGSHYLLRHTTAHPILIGTLCAGRETQARLCLPSRAPIPGLAGSPNLV